MCAFLAGQSTNFRLAVNKNNFEYCATTKCALSYHYNHVGRHPRLLIPAFLNRGLREIVVGEIGWMEADDLADDRVGACG